MLKITSSLLLILGALCLVQGVTFYTNKKARDAYCIGPLAPTKEDRKNPDHPEEMEYRCGDAPENKCYLTTKDQDANCSGASSKYEFTLPRRLGQGKDITTYHCCSNPFDKAAKCFNSTQKGARDGACAAKLRYRIDYKEGQSKTYCCASAKWNKPSPWVGTALEVGSPIKVVAGNA